MILCQLVPKSHCPYALIGLKTQIWGGHSNVMTLLLLMTLTLMMYHELRLIQVPLLLALDTFIYCTIM